MEIREGFISYIYNGIKSDITFSTSGSTAGEGIKVNSSSKECNNGKKLELSIVPDEQLTICEIYLKVNIRFDNEDRIYLNGFQTWTDSREFKTDEKIYPLNTLARTIMRQYGDYTFYSCSGRQNLHGWTYTYVNRGNTGIDFFGSLTEKNGYTLFDYDTRSGNIYIRKELEELSISSTYKAFEIYIASGNERDIFDEYFSLMEIGKPAVKQCTGWTSWYNYYTGITEEIILSNLEAFKKRNIPINTFQIDDGYQNAVGDWLVVNNKFPNGMGKIAGRIKESGYKAGLWLAPFICEKKSLIYRDHYDWVLKDTAGKPVKAGFNPGWSGIFYAMDFYNEGYRNYLREVFDTVYSKWGFDMVKLDFLYAAALISKKDKTRGQAMYEAMSFLREISKDKIILGCGVPLGPSFGLVDYCRIGSDVALKWEDNLLKGIHYRERVSTINSLASTAGRRHLNGRAFYNDPDVFILREKNNKLTETQRDTLFILNLIFGGLVFTSDNVDEYTDKELKKYLSMFPFKEKIIKNVSGDYESLMRVDFSIDDKDYTVFSNLGEIPCEAGSDFDGWTSSKGFVGRDEKIKLQPFETICLLKIKEEDFSIVGSTGNVFPGSEIAEFEVLNENISIRIDTKAVNGSEVYIRIPGELKGYKVNGKYFDSQIEGKFTIIKTNLSH